MASEESPSYRISSVVWHCIVSLVTETRKILRFSALKELKTCIPSFSEMSNWQDLLFSLLSFKKP